MRPCMLVGVPAGAVQKLPEGQQAAVVAAVFAALGLGTWWSLACFGPWFGSLFPALAQV